MNYKKFEKLAKEWHGKVCMFGAGLIGRTWGYEIAKAAGFNIDFYCDNNICENVTIRTNIKTISKNDLYSYGDEVLVLLTVNERYQQEIKLQLNKNQIFNILEMGDEFCKEFYFSIEEQENEELNKKYEMLMDDSKYLMQRFNHIMGYYFDIENPITFNEKLQRLKVTDRKKDYINMVDKYEAKKYVSSFLGEEYIIPIYGVWNSFEQIDFDKLPDSFVLKTTNDSGGVVICSNKETFDIFTAKEKIEKSLKDNFYLGGREWAYKDIKPRIIAEEYIISEYDKQKDSIINGILDYKVHCFNGIPMYIQVIGNRNYQNHTGYQLIYDFSWNIQEWSFGDYPKYEVEIPEPSHLKEMYECSKILAENKNYVRIDWYDTKEQLKFGEITTIPNSGYYIYNTDWTKEIDIYLGNLIKDI